MLLYALTILVSLAGCTPVPAPAAPAGEAKPAAQAEPTKAPEAAAPQSAEQVTLAYWRAGGASSDQFNDKQMALVKKFEDANPNIKIQPQLIPFPEYDSKSLTALQAKEGPDLIEVNSVSLGMFTSKGLVQPLDDLLANSSIKKENFVDLVVHYRNQLRYGHTNEGELAAFISYAQAFPDGFLALVDTYNTLQSGVPNFICVALALLKIGYKPTGVRLDSGDLAYFSKETRKLLRTTAARFRIASFSSLTIVASNDIDEAILSSLQQQGHEIDVFGIGTHLVTCRSQPALGCVYKLVAINGHPRIKLSDEADKMTIPGRKDVYRLVGDNRHPLIDLMVEAGKPAPKAGDRILCRHPVSEAKRAYVIPKSIIPLHRCVWDGRQTFAFPSLDAIRDYVQDQLAVMRPDHLRAVNPTPYKVAVSEDLYRSMHELWMQEAPVSEIS